MHDALVPQDFNNTTTRSVRGEEQMTSRGPTRCPFVDRTVTTRAYTSDSGRTWPAVHVESLARAKARRNGREEQHAVADLVGLAESARRVGHTDRLGIQV